MWFIMDFFLFHCLGGFVLSILAGLLYLIKSTVAPRKTPYDIWFSEAKKQSAVRLHSTSNQ